MFLIKILEVEFLVLGYFLVPKWKWLLEGYSCITSMCKRAMGIHELCGPECIILSFCSVSDCVSIVISLAV